jgi:hypothetical protein
MFKSYTGGGTAFAGLEKKLSGGSPDDPAVPAGVRKAGRFMLAGAAITGFIGLFEIVVVIIDRSLIAINGKPLTSSELAQGLIFLVFAYGVGTALWILMARFTRAGQNWARIVSSVLFAISTWLLYASVNSLKSTITVADIISIVFTVAIWIAGVGAVALLWRAESSLYFKGLYAPPRRR